MLLKIVLLLLIYAGLNITAQTFNKYALNEMNARLSMQNLLSVLTNGYIITGIVLQVAAMVLWFFVLDKIKLTIAMPLVYGITFILLIPSSYFILGEKVGIREVIGIFSIFVGIWILSYKI